MSEVKNIIYKLKKDGYNLKKRLGEGGYGYAYELDNGKVLKLTTDKREANASSLVVGKSFKNVVKIYDVWSYVKFDNWYFIEQERLSPINKKEVEKWLESYIKFDNNEILLDRFFYQVFTGELNLTDAKEKLEQNVDEPYYDFAQDMIYAAKELLSLNIIWKDLHADNVLKNGNIYKVIDLGYSKSPGRVRDVRESLKLVKIIKNLNWR